MRRFVAQAGVQGMNIEQMIRHIPLKEAAKIASGEHKITREQHVSCITIPLAFHLELLDARVALKKRKKR